MLKQLSNEKKKLTEIQKLPKNYQMIRFQLDGKQDFLEGKVVKRHKPTSAHKNVDVIQFADGSIEEFLAILLPFWTILIQFLRRLVR